MIEFGLKLKHVEEAIYELETPASQDPGFNLQIEVVKTKWIKRLFQRI